MAESFSVAARNAAADAVTALIDAGSGPGEIQIRTGTKPVTPETAASGTLLVTLLLNDPSFNAAASGVAAGRVTPPPAGTGVAAGTAGWARVLDSTGAAVMDVDVTAAGGGGDIELSTTTISVGLSVSLTTLTPYFLRVQRTGASNQILSAVARHDVAAARRATLSWSRVVPLSPQDRVSVSLSGNDFGRIINASATLDVDFRGPNL